MGLQRYKFSFEIYIFVDNNYLSIERVSHSIEI